MDGSWTVSPSVSPGDDRSPELAPIAAVLDSVLVPLGFAPAQIGASGTTGQAIFCRGHIGSADGACVDLVLDVAAAPDWRIVDVRYWGFPSDRWHLSFDRTGSLADQLSDLARTLPPQLV